MVQKYHTIFAIPFFIVQPKGRKGQFRKRRGRNICTRWCWLTDDGRPLPVMFSPFFSTCMFLQSKLVLLWGWLLFSIQYQPSSTTKNLQLCNGTYLNNIGTYLKWQIMNGQIQDIFFRKVHGNRMSWVGGEKS